MLENLSEEGKKNVRKMDHLLNNDKTDTARGSGRIDTEAKMTALVEIPDRREISDGAAF